jgi:hypothetical protein
VSGFAFQGTNAHALVCSAPRARSLLVSDGMAYKWVSREGVATDSHRVRDHSHIRRDGEIQRKKKKEKREKKKEKRKKWGAKKSPKCARTFGGGGVGREHLAGVDVVVLRALGGVAHHLR